MNKYIFSTLLLASVPLVSLADCPPPSAVVQSCSPTGLCNWQAPWYEGFSIGGNHGDSKAVKFLYAEWGKKVDASNNNGSTLCYYLGDKGTLIKMSQNDWGNVSKPDGSNWLTLVGDKYSLMHCSYDCHFDYGE